ncbi:hypothetical protein STRTUCAR8_08542 [Streptomyces turgidiscabies Car8]|uniref:Uncharacterized protein n=1 Tax=Streptomyces turgidiscabies (strain Car8) TaxID=698760 RepID=L7F9B1_STRT8|nr:hypothetical protein [Streptomyces turgidiscabies]ELP67704.1 hypothetical protein STRTUCAR8_08542 [Streptomyces turgidiscabies Car8]
MSTSQSSTDYQVQLDVAGHGAQLFAAIDLPAQLGITDALALAFVKALQDFPWPAGTTTNVQVNKSSTTSVFFETHLETDPPVFT